MSTGGSHSILSETMVALSVPVMKKIVSYQQKKELENGGVHFWRNQ